MDLRFKLACLHHNCHRFEIIEEEQENDAMGTTMPIRKRRSNAQARITSVRKNLPPSHEWKKEILKAVTQRYMAQKGENVRDEDENEDEEAWEEIPTDEIQDDIANLVRYLNLDDD